MDTTIEQKKANLSMSEQHNSFGDFIQPFQIEDLGLHGRLVRLGGSLDLAFARHDYPNPVSTLLGETMALATALAGAIKYEGIFTLQIQGDGPINLMMADLTSEGDLRGYVRYDSDSVTEASDRTGAIVPKYLGAGHMAFTVDQGPDTERYQGIVDLAGERLTDCAQNYFKQSEQLETALIVAADTRAEHGSKSAALMIQRLPSDAEGTYSRDDDDDAWRRAVVLMSSVTTEELLDPDLSSSQLLYRLYHEDGVRLFDVKPVQQTCRCSEQKIKNTLASFPKSEVLEMAEDGNVSIVCEFCKTEYIVTLSELPFVE
jgi:molecular chaperone Hsp33